MNLGDIIGNVVDAITGNDQHDERNARPASEDPFGDPADQQVAPASQDPFGDPADFYNGEQVASASQDPYGDPADQVNGQNVLDASQDPYGDPADEEQAAAQPAQRGGGWPF